MICLIHRPSFWPEPRDPWAWQRALQTLATLDVIPGPWPCWEKYLRSSLSRRSVAGLYGLRAQPTPPALLGLALLKQTPEGWALTPEARTLRRATRDAFQLSLASLLVRRSPWVRLALAGLLERTWTIPRGLHALTAGGPLRVGVDLLIPPDALRKPPAARLLLGELHRPSIATTHFESSPLNALSALHSPLYLLHSVGWLDGAAHPKLPDELARTFGTLSPSALLRGISAEEADVKGFVPLDKVVHRLHSELGRSGKERNAHAWMDQVIGTAIARGTIEIHEWSPGQPRHGRGLFGDRDKKLVRWTVHDDFQTELDDARPPRLRTNARAVGVEV